MKRVILTVVTIVALAGAATSLRAQDAVKADAKHYTVAFENDQVRVLKVHYGAHEKSVLHEHPNSVAVFVTDGKIKFTLPDGTSREAEVKAGQTAWNAAGKHQPENLGDKPFEVVVVELKTK